jgi:short subunit dehydrogenase-like uncharacterized protein
VLDVLLFGATGHTGRLVAAALGRRRARFAVAGRDRSRLEAVARQTGAQDVAVVQAGEVERLADAAEAAQVLLTCVGPFTELGSTAVDAALAARAHYVDSTGEASFVARLRARWSEPARAARLTLAPAMGFDEVAADVAATLAVEGMTRADLTLTYALPSHASDGSVRSAVDVLTAHGSWLREGARVPVVTGQVRRWAPMPPPLGPRPSFSAYMAEAELAPLHLDVTGVATFLTTSPLRSRGLGPALWALRKAAGSPSGRHLLERLLRAAAPRPGGERARRARWTVLAEASSNGPRRAVVLSGKDVYRLSAELLATGALELANMEQGSGGVKAPVQAIGLAALRRELEAQGTTIAIYEAHGKGE